MTWEQRACYANRTLQASSIQGSGAMARIYGGYFSMIRKMLKWIGTVLGSLIGLLVFIFSVLYIIGKAKW